MGKRLIQQARGKGSSTYRAHGFRFAGNLSYNEFGKGKVFKAKIIELVHSKGHSAPLLRIKYLESGKQALIPSFLGAYLGQEIEVNQSENVNREDIKKGSAYMLKNLPEGTQIYNVEINPGDSGKLVKAGGVFATVVGKVKDKVKIVLPSKKEKILSEKCRAFVGQIGASGRLEKPFLKAGNKFYEMKKKNKLYPKVSGVAQSGVDHPFGSSRSLRKGRPTIAPKNAPPGRKVGMLRPKHTGRNK